MRGVFILFINIDAINALLKLRKSLGPGARGKQLFGRLSLKGD